jgi:hypothetical protein
LLWTDEEWQAASSGMVCMQMAAGLGGGCWPVVLLQLAASGLIHPQGAACAYAYVFVHHAHALHVVFGS